MNDVLATAPDGLADAMLPPERRGVARDAVRLLVTDRVTHRHVHARFSDLPTLLKPGDLLVVNDSATLPAAVRARRSNGDELALHVATMIDTRLWLAEPRGAVHIGERLELADGASALLIAPVDECRPRVWYTRMDLPLPMHEFLAAHGEPIRYSYVTERVGLADYQTLFARVPGSSEMPSAARPFTPRVVQALRRNGVRVAAITLHCGVASFEAPERPVIERFSVSSDTADAVNRARADGRRVVAVGTTVVRALESAITFGRLTPASGWTDLIVDASHRVTTVDGLLTGFHAAGATHQWMLRAFLDRAAISAAYDEAVERGYLRHEFGDVHLIV